MISGTRLAEILQDILNENQEYDLLCNPYFRISKINCESLKKYNSLLNPKNKIFKIIGSPVVIISISKNLLIYFVGGIFLSRQYKKFKILNKNSKVLFISHATNNNLTGDTDVYFASLPNFLGEDTCSILYLNHLRTRYESNYKKLIQKKNCTNVLLLPKFLRPSEFLDYIKHTLNLLKDHLSVIKVYSSKDSQKKKIIIEALNWIFARETYNNYLMIKRLLEIQNTIQIDKAFLTLEGHSYEGLLSSQLKRGNPRISLFLYQHSPITAAHSGVRNFLESLRFNLTILTTGNNYSEYLSKLSKNIEIFCIGSIKKMISRSPKNIQITSILIAPEGTKQSVFKMLKIMTQLCKKNPDYNFVLRLHPNLKIGFVMRLLLFNLTKLKNGEISKENLEFDLYRTQVTFYVGSTVAIQALSFGNLPIFINLENNKDLNVMSILEQKFPIIEIQENGLISLDVLKKLKIKDFNFEASEDLFTTFNLPIELRNKLKL
jgi:hypothetical protein